MKMKPCPFCKKPAVLMDHDWGDCPPITNWGVGCSDHECWAAADPDCCWHPSPEEAIKLWDKRIDEMGNSNGN